METHMRPVLVRDQDFRPQPGQHWLEVRDAPYGLVIQEYWKNNVDFKDFVFTEPWETHGGSGEHEKDPALIMFGFKMSDQLGLPFVIYDGDWDVVWAMLSTL